MKATAIAIILSVGLVGAAIIFSGSGGGGGSDTVPTPTKENVTIVDGKQIIEIDARGGYFPRKSIAEAGIPTVIRFNTTNTFDCSAAVRIPSLNITKVLPQSGQTDIDIGTPEAGPFVGSCTMGMYPFEVEFK